MRIHRKLSDKYGSEAAVAFINPSAVPPKKNAMAEDDDVIFTVKTYNKLNVTTGTETWEVFFKLTNEFIESLSDADQEALYNFYSSAATVIKRVDEASITKVVDKIKSLLNSLIRSTDLVRKMADFVDTNERIPYPNLSSVGQRVQDNERFTFRLPEYKRLTALSLMCKLMSPIWGDFIYRTGSYVETMNKEAICIGMFYPVLNHSSFTEVTEKLVEYVDKNVRVTFNKLTSGHANGGNYDVEFITAYAGFGKDRFFSHVYSLLLVKKFALYDPMPEINPDGTINLRNIMTYVAFNIPLTVNTIISGLQKKSATMVRIDPSQVQTSSGDTDSVTFLENESNISTMSADTPIILAAGVMKDVDRFIRRAAIPDKIVSACVRHFSSNHPTLNPLSIGLMSIFYRGIIGGSATLKYLHAPQIEKMMAVLQVQMIERSVSHQLIHMLSAQSPKESRSGPLPLIGQRIHMTYETKPVYRACINQFQESMNPSRSIRSQIQGIVSWITGRDHCYNTPDAIIQYGEMDPVRQGSLVKYDEDIAQDVVMFLTAFGIESSEQNADQRVS